MIMRAKAFTLARNLKAFKTTRAIADRNSCYREIFDAALTEMSVATLVDTLCESGVAAWIYAGLKEIGHLNHNDLAKLKSTFAKVADEHWAAAGLIGLYGFSDDDRKRLLRKVLPEHHKELMGKAAVRKDEIAFLGADHCQVQVAA
jgi:hypothetical protein